MGKWGLSHGLAEHGDPTYEKALSDIRKEERAEKESRKATAFSFIKAIRFYLKGNGYELADDLVIRELCTNRIYRSSVPACKKCKRMKY